MVIVLFFILFLVAPLPTHAQVVINEVFPAPKPGSSEWIELYNAGETATQLDGWSLSDQLSSPTVIHTFSDQTIYSQDFLVIELTSAKLNNSADGVTLKNPSNEIIDQMSYSSSKTGLSWSKNTTHEFELTSPTKSLANISPTPSPSPISTPQPSPLPSLTPSPSPLSTPTPTDTSYHQLISVTKFMACPSTGESEWIQLYNADSESHTLSGWRIRDRNNQTRLINTTIAAQSSEVVSWSGSLLNNSGDEFDLENEQGVSLQHLAYNDCQTNTPTLFTPTANPNSPTPLPSSSPTSAPATLVTPPSPPPALTSAPDIWLSKTSQTTSVASVNRKINFQARKLPMTALLSVILGGGCLFISSGWKLYAEIFKTNPNH